MQAESVLEFEKLRAVVARYVRSALGRDAMEKLAPGWDRAAIEDALADAAEGIAYLRASSQPQPAQRGAAIRIRFGEIRRSRIVGRADSAHRRARRWKRPRFWKSHACWIWLQKRARF